MKKIKLFSQILFLLVLPFCIGCQATGTTSQNQILASDTSQVNLRAMQSRVFDTTDKAHTLRIVMATLLDLDFVIDKADLTAGVVTGTKFDDNTAIKITVTAQPRGTTQVLVRATVQYGLRAVESPKPYQDFFATFEKAMFLTAHQL